MCDLTALLSTLVLNNTAKTTVNAWSEPAGSSLCTSEVIENICSSNRMIFVLCENISPASLAPFHHWLICLSVQESSGPVTVTLFQSLRDMMNKERSA